VQECAAGLITVRRGADALSFAAPPRVREGALEDDYLHRIAAAFGITPDRVLAHQWVDNGPGWAVVQLATAEEVLALEPDLSRIPTAMVGAIGAHPDGSRHRFEMRTFAPALGVAEDPACGSMNAAVGQWLTATGADPPLIASPKAQGWGGPPASRSPPMRTAPCGSAAQPPSASAAPSRSDRQVVSADNVFMLT
jgi:PhzF family phenazine biosynthesis protein